jgi:hypothetical protein
VNGKSKTVRSWQPMYSKLSTVVMPARVAASL